MNPFRVIGKFYAKAGAVTHALDNAAKRGLTDDLVLQALVWARVAAKKEDLDNDQRRAWVTQVLVDKRVPESVARLAVELAVQTLKSQAD